MKLTVGQELFYVSKNTGRKKIVAVKKIGRKWAYVSGLYRGRVDIKTLAVDGGNYSSPGQCYLSEKAYRDELELDKAWRELVYHFNWIKRPERISISSIKVIRNILDHQPCPYFNPEYFCSLEGGMEPEDREALK